MSARKLRIVLGLLYCLLAVFSGRGEAAAHAIVVGSSLDNGAVPALTETVVVLRLNVVVELGFTQVVLLETGGERPLKVLPESTAKAISVELPALAPGNYVLRYRVLATDGHLTEYSLRFSVVQGR